MFVELLAASTRVAMVFANCLLDWMVPMALQLAILVLVLFVVSRWILPKTSARFRYALWMLVPIRLMLPPTLAFVTGWGWWLMPMEKWNEPSQAETPYQAFSTVRLFDKDIASNSPVRNHGVSSHDTALSLDRTRFEVTDHGHGINSDQHQLPWLLMKDLYLPVRGRFNQLFLAMANQS